MIVRMFAEWCSPNPDNLVLVRLIPAWFGSVWWFQWFLALIWSGLEMIFNIGISICFNVNDSSELYNAKIVRKRFFAWKPEFWTYFTENGGFWKRHFRKKWGFSDFCPKLNHFFKPNDILEGWDDGIMCSTHVIWIFAYFWINFNTRCPFGTSKMIQMILIPFHKWLEIE